MSTVSEVRLWGRTIGAVALEEGRDTAVFEFDPSFARSGIEIAPTRQMKSATTQAKIGLSMKKLGIDQLSARSASPVHSIQNQPRHPRRSTPSP